MSGPARQICEMTEMYEAFCVSKERFTSMLFMCVCSVMKSEHGGCCIEFVEEPLKVVAGATESEKYRHSATCWVNTVNCEATVLDNCRCFTKTMRQRNARVRPIGSPVHDLRAISVNFDATFLRKPDDVRESRDANRGGRTYRWMLYRVCRGAPGSHFA